MDEAVSSHKQLQPTDERSDGCWQGRAAFLDMCLRHQADKGAIHGYWRLYGLLFERLRKFEGLRLAEFGLANGASLRVWADFFNADATFYMNDLNCDRCDSIMQGLSSQLQKRVYMHHLGMYGDKPPRGLEAS